MNGIATGDLTGTRTRMVPSGVTVEGVVRGCRLCPKKSERANPSALGVKGGWGTPAPRSCNPMEIFERILAGQGY